METDISVRALRITTEDTWSVSEIQKAQLEDPDIIPIMEKKLKSADRPCRHEIAPESPVTKRYWALWDFLRLKDGVFYHSNFSLQQCSHLALKICKLAASLTRQECKLETSYCIRVSHYASNLQQACYVTLIANYSKNKELRQTSDSNPRQPTS
ncbi:hypothetical protein AVEN_268251-1 [Araneus ventricosus]|uniref:Uncharacterized protein n=1 Tax=Araneus ventricosus TaxID=182803 RepID=A0A4Y2C221_ARAVE|nr:hypothetical protein AVEN_268251-1 [Araneus ventricosus]